MWNVETLECDSFSMNCDSYFVLGEARLEGSFQEESHESGAGRVLGGRLSCTGKQWKGYGETPRRGLGEKISGDGRGRAHAEPQLGQSWARILGSGKIPESSG